MEMGSALYAIAFKTGVLLSIVAFASRILASRSAACRHLLWSIALVLSLLLPLASLILPSVLTVAVPSYLPVAAIGVPLTATVDSLNAGLMLGAFWLCGMVVLLVRQARMQLARFAGRAERGWFRAHRGSRHGRACRAVEALRDRCACSSQHAIRYCATGAQSERFCSCPRPVLTGRRTSAVMRCCTNSPTCGAWIT